MKRPLIGITSGQTKLFETETFSGSAISYTLSDVSHAVWKAGGLPMLIPDHSASESHIVIDQLDGLLLSGGPDVTPYLYGQDVKEKLGKTDIHRDQRELALIDAAVKKKLPIMGICRGLQLMNVYLNGTLFQDLSYMGLTHHCHNQLNLMYEEVHGLTVDPDTRLAQLLPDDLQVNSIHHQAVDQLAEELTAVAWSEDGVIEAVESNTSSLDFVGVQYHPECLIDKDSSHLAVFQDLVARAQQRVYV